MMKEQELGLGQPVEETDLFQRCEEFLVQMDLYDLDAEESGSDDTHP